MVDSPKEPASRDAPVTPRWVKALGIAAIAVALFVIAVMLSAGGEHGPGRHAASTDARDAAMQQEHADAMAHMPEGMAHALPNSVTLQPGETEKLSWRFGDTVIEYGCHEPGHYQAGMRGRITIA